MVQNVSFTGNLIIGNNVSKYINSSSQDTFKKGELALREYVKLNLPEKSIIDLDVFESKMNISERLSLKYIDEKGKLMKSRLMYPESFWKEYQETKINPIIAFIDMARDNLKNIKIFDIEV